MSEVQAKVRLNLTDIAVGVPNDEAIKAGADSNMEVILRLALPLPIMNPQTQEPLVTPLIDLVVNFNKDQALSFSETLVEAAEHLADVKKKSDIVVASNLGQVEQAAAELDRMRAPSS